MLALISAGRPEWAIAAVIVAAVGGALAGWSARRSGGVSRGRVRMVAAGLKFLALALLAACLIEPVWSGLQPKPHSNLFVVLADNSASLTVNADSSGEDNDSASQPESSAADKEEKATDDAEAEQANDSKVAPESESRPSIGDQMRLALKTRDGSWLHRLQQDFELHQFAFDRRLRHVADFESLDFAGQSSALRSALGSTAQRFRGRPVGGVVLLSDGNATDLTQDDLKQMLAAIEELPPVFPVVFHDADSKPDLAIDTVSISQTPFEDAPVSIQCDVTATGFEFRDDARASVVCRLINQAGEAIKTEKLPLGNDRLPFRFEFRPVNPGVWFYRLETEIERPDEADVADAASEMTEANNARLIQVDRGSRKNRVLYVCGRPNWEFKFLRRALDDDEQVDLVGMIRVAKREAKFDFRGRDGQSSNSLYRGFKKDSDAETEQYDEPVLVRLNTKDAKELAGGFPKKPEELFEYDAIILDDVEAAFFKHEQLALISQFVSRRGGSLLMLGGQESFQTGEYDRTPVGDVLPVYLDRATFPGEDLRVKLELTREGWLQPWVRLRANESDERGRLQTMPGFRTLNPTRGIKPGASVMATVTDGQGTIWPALVTQKFGRGRSAAMLIGDLWRWQLQRVEDHPDDLAKAWRQTIRWLVADVPGRVELKTDAAVDVAPEAVRISVQVSDTEFNPLENARVAIRVEGPVRVGGDEKEKEESAQVVLTAEPSTEKPGLYSTVFIPREPGAWKLTATAVTMDGEELSPSVAGWVYEPLADEFRSTTTNRELLTALAEESGGRLIEAEDLDEFASELKSEPMPVMETWTMPLWDHPLVFLIVISCLAGEWGLRRTRGLA